MKNHKRIVVALSGGVDSSVAAALLVEQGYDVVGMMLRLWNEPKQEVHNRCCNPDSINSARTTANMLNIPFYVIDTKKEFRKQVVEYFIDGYSRGITPNPCLICNQRIRWGFLLDKVRQSGADYLATGHYARVSNIKNDKRLLLRGVDSKKDQSYVLYGLTQDQLSSTKFPLGNSTKHQIRQIAQKYNLPVYDRSESQDLCFIGNDSYKSFLLRQAPFVKKPGRFISPDGQHIGEHKGLAFYTIGQRRGLGISASIPLYVIHKDIPTNTIILGNKEDLVKDSFRIAGVNWISGIANCKSFACTVQTRYRSKELSCIVNMQTNDEIHVDLIEPSMNITPGQAAVFYDRDNCLGGGIIQ